MKRRNFKELRRYVLKKVNKRLIDRKMLSDCL